MTFTTRAYADIFASPPASRIRFMCGGSVAFLSFSIFRFPETVTEQLLLLLLISASGLCSACCSSCSRLRLDQCGGDEAEVPGVLVFREVSALLLAKDESKSSLGRA